MSIFGDGQMKICEKVKRLDITEILLLKIFLCSHF